MKTPDEIKKALACTEARIRNCTHCAYWPDNCVEHVQLDALAYIQQLESRLAQAERERDAAVRDLQKISFCEDCKHLGKSKKRNPCRECQENYKEKTKLAMARNMP